MIEIEDNIPIPPLSQPFRSVFTDAMEDMKVGQSFVFDSIEYGGQNSGRCNSNTNCGR